MPFLPLDHPECAGRHRPHACRRDTCSSRERLRAEPAPPGSPRPRRIFNSILVFGEGGTLAGVYDKIHLVPFGEYLPLQRLLEAIGLQQLTRLRGGFDVGRAAAPAAARAAPARRCAAHLLRGHLPRARSCRAPSGPALMLNVTNDGWFGDTTGPRQHLHRRACARSRRACRSCARPTTASPPAIDGYGRILRAARSRRARHDRRGAAGGLATAALRAPGRSGLSRAMADRAGRVAAASGAECCAHDTARLIGCDRYEMRAREVDGVQCLHLPIVRREQLRTGLSCRGHPVSSTSGGGDEKGSRRPNPIDVHVGSRVRFRRMLLGMSQEKLGEKLGLTFQQVQKYEKGINRIGASRLFDLAQVLGVPVQFFYEEAPVRRAAAAHARRALPRSRPRTPSSSSCAAATAWSSTRRSCASPMPRRAAPSSISCAAWPTTTPTTIRWAEGAWAEARPQAPDVAVAARWLPASA